MQQNQKENGFAHIGLILAAVALIAALAFGAWWVWNKNKKEGSKQTSNTIQQPNQSESQTLEQKDIAKSKTFNCKDVFTLSYPYTLQATVTSAGQCLVSNVSVDAMPAVGPLPPEQLGLFFSTKTTKFTTSKDYLDDYINRSQEDNPLILKSQEGLQLNSGKFAILATVNGGHPTKYDFFLFIYVRDGIAITTSYPLNSNYKEVALNILKSIQ